MNAADTKNYWDAYYKNGGPCTSQCSSFAVFCLPYIDTKKVLFEMGCGSGRDAIFFCRNNIPTVGVDRSLQAVELVQHKVEMEYPDSKDKIRCVQADFETLSQTFDKNRPFEGIEIGTVYSRFTLHAVQRRLASAMLKWAADNLSVGGLLCIEARSVLSSMYGKGTQSDEDPDAFIYGHYRRFIRKSQLVEELTQLGFSIVCEEERDGVAVFGDDDPVVVRIIARKNGAASATQLN